MKSAALPTTAEHEPRGEWSSGDPAKFARSGARRWHCRIPALYRAYFGAAWSPEITFPARHQEQLAFRCKHITGDQPRTTGSFRSCRSTTASSRLCATQRCVHARTEFYKGGNANEPARLFLIECESRPGNRLRKFLAGQHRSGANVAPATSAAATTPMIAPFRQYRSRSRRRSMSWMHATSFRQDGSRSKPRPTPPMC